MSDNQENNNENSEKPKAWHYAAFGGAPQGPVTETELNSLHKTGKISDATLIWSEGQPKWLSYSFLFPNLLPPVLGPPVVPGNSTLATLESRLGAWFIDQLIAVGFMLPGSLFLITANGESVNAESLQKALWLMGSGLLLYILIQGSKISETGQSMGKAALDIKIVGFQAEENPGFAGAYLIRSILPTLIAVIPYVGWLFALLNILLIFTPARRCLHDYFAETKVIKLP